MTKPVRSHVLDFGSLSPDCNYLYARHIPQELSFPSQSIPDCLLSLVVYMNLGSFG